MGESHKIEAMPFPIQVQLVPVAVLRALRGITADAIQDAVDAGRLKFVWNINPRGNRGQICQLRFWIRELLAPGSVAHLSLAAAIGAILGERRTQWRGAEIAQMLLVSRPTIHHLNRGRVLAGRIQGNTLWIARPALERFLTDRCLFHQF